MEQSCRYYETGVSKRTGRRFWRQASGWIRKLLSGRCMPWQAPRIAATGCRHSGIACIFAHLMCCAEKPARFLSPAEAVHGAGGFMQSGDSSMGIQRR